MLVLTRSLDRDASEEGIRPQVIREALVLVIALTFSADLGFAPVLVSGIIGMPIAGAATLIRLLLRRHRLWWDDLLAGLSALSLLMTGVSGKLLYSINGMHICLASHCLLKRPGSSSRGQHHPPVKSSRPLLHRRRHVRHDYMVSISTC